MAKVTLLFYRAFDNPHATLLDKLVAWIDGGSHSPRHRASGSRDWRSSEERNTTTPNTTQQNTTKCLDYN